MSAPWKNALTPWSRASRARSFSISAASPNPFSITFTPSRASASAIARPMPLVEPVTTALLPTSSLPIAFPFLVLSDFPARLVRLQGRRAQHLDVQDAVFVVRLRCNGEAELVVEALEMLLRTD